MLMRLAFFVSLTHTDGYPSLLRSAEEVTYFSSQNQEYPERSSLCTYDRIESEVLKRCSNAGTTYTGGESFWCLLKNNEGFGA